ncbi:MULTISPECIES: hypothetical protein [unclassified Leeuwenhoekiella]|uniref:hypothetical protein n=1 Tax=unclassified Leeuwenhoekiella TaxID=2615029 RepID=UPI000C67D353|nr:MULTISPECIES: hypothetical protein [unclassified Leeuwenhoekiella]MAS71548.1 hypothetical protein [Zunongwangia sp.]MAW96287.1 hypothetical protein [Leeuwenhoekiella sp.]MBA82778.1 hypothetical protein [Leeuwenhoekiella sp.]|tara:strand:+ start:6210 stop:6791 length:582 start_codon:yes stop_codon:yes gene_type:complete
MPRDPLDQLHSIRFRKPGIGLKAVLNPDQEKNFSRFLINALGPDIFVISTGLGLDIYYSNKEDCSVFIRNNLWLFQGTEEKSPSDILAEKNHGRDVLNYFGTVVNTLVSYPLLLLSCCKKFMKQYQSIAHKSRLHFLLYASFQYHLQGLITDAKVPYVKKIKKLLNESNATDFEDFSNHEKLVNHFKKSQNLN